MGFNNKTVYRSPKVRLGLSRLSQKLKSISQGLLPHYCCRWLCPWAGFLRLAKWPWSFQASIQFSYTTVWRGNGSHLFLRTGKACSQKPTPDFPYFLLYASGSPLSAQYYINHWEGGQDCYNSNWLKLTVLGGINALL